MLAFSLECQASFHQPEYTFQLLRNILIDVILVKMHSLSTQVSRDKY